jgi:tRNA threonylcarbamoyl adenosine modification protein YeaZ
MTAGGGIVLAIDTSTRRAAIALGTCAGEILGETSWECGYRHGQEVLATLDGLLLRAGVGLGRVEALVAGTGPGAFTGLRVGLATAKALAHGLGRPIVGVPSTQALAEAAWQSGEAGSADELVVIMPAGPHDRYVAIYGRPDGSGTPEAIGQPQLVTEADAADALAAPSGHATGRTGGRIVVAVDLAPAGAVDEWSAGLGRRAQEGLGPALLRQGCRRAARGDVDDVSLLVPSYVTLPRGAAEVSGAIRWSSDRR